MVKTKLKIDRNVPIPPAHGKGRGRSEFSLTVQNLEVGDSMFVPDKIPSQLSGALFWNKLRYNRQFTMRSIDGGVRVWRTK